MPETITPGNRPRHNRPLGIRLPLPAAQTRAAAASALAAVVRAFRRSAESHVDAARQHERSAAAGFGDSDFARFGDIRWHNPLAA